MDSQVNTEYSTPKSNKNMSKDNSSELIGNINGCQISDEVFQNLMSDPLKRELILNIITSEKDKIDAYKKKLDTRNQLSPFHKALKKPCESPTALHRRRVLERLRNPQCSDNTSESGNSRPTSRQSTSSSSHSPRHSPIPFDKILDGVVAYVEVKSGVRDRSEAVKSHLRCMGALVREQFTKDVTHVIFKEGQFATYQKANLMKVHLVSVLWLEACKTSGIKVPEKKYPAFGTSNYDHNVSMLCSQIQKDYEEIIHEEFQKNIQMGIPLPSTKSLINRRKTLATPLEIGNVTKRTKKARSSLTFYTSDDDTMFDDNSDTNPIIDGDISEGNSEFFEDFVIRKKNKFTSTQNAEEDMDLTNIHGGNGKENQSPNKRSQNEDFYRRRTRIFNVSNTVDKLSPRSARIFDKNKLTPEDASTELTPRSLRIFNKNDLVDGTNTEKPAESTGSCMSSLRVSDNSKNGAKNSFNAEKSNASFSPLPPNVINDLLNNLQDSSEEDDLKSKRRKSPAKKTKTTPPKEGSDQIRMRTRRQTINVLNNSPSKQLKRSKSSIDLGKNVSSPDSQNKKKFRKLYTPSEFRELVVDDEKEREEKRRAKKPKSKSGVFIKPNTLFPKTKDISVKNTTESKKSINKKHDDEQVEIMNKKDNVRIETPRRQSKKINNDEVDILNKKDNVPIETPKKQSKKIINDEVDILNKKNNVRKETPRRQSQRIISIKNTPVTPSVTRRSTLEFQSLTQSAKKRLKIDAVKKPSIVCTKMHKSDVQVFTQIVKKIGGFEVENEVSEKTTHLVAGEPKRTINMLKALAMGCWILKKKWLFCSLESGKWLQEEDFEETDFSPAVQKNRIQRQAFGPSYTMDIFQDYGPMYVAKGSIPRSSDLRELIQLCKGRITAVPRCAAIVVGEYVEYEGVTCVKETWVLDCISQNKKYPFKKYLIK